MGVGNLAYSSVKGAAGLAQTLYTPAGQDAAILDAQILAENVRVGNITPGTVGNSALNIGKAIVKPVTDPWSKGQYTEAVTRGFAEVATLPLASTKLAKLAKLGEAADAEKAIKAEEAIKAEKALEAERAGQAKTAQEAEGARTPENEPGVHIKPKQLEPTEIPCFRPLESKKFPLMNAEQKREYLEEYARQLRRQEEAINSVSAAKYKEARDLFEDLGRNPAAKAAQGRYAKQFAQDVQESMTTSLTPKYGAVAASQMAEERTKDLMSQLAALHEPDNVAGGFLSPVPKGMGDRGVNSAIGPSWNQESRVSSMDAAAGKAIASGNGDALMNVRLKPCGAKRG